MAPVKSVAESELMPPVPFWEAAFPLTGPFSPSNGDGIPENFDL